MYFCNSFANFMDALTILSKSGLSKTRNRLNILKALELAKTPLSGKEIIYNLPEKCDKSTVHRTLNALFEKKLLQRVIVDHEVKYAISYLENSGNGHKNDHIHFKCSVCQELFCFKEIEVRDYQLPQGFVKEENQFLIIGKCKACQ